MSIKLLRILSFVPAANLFVIVYCFIKRLIAAQVLKAILRMLIWVGIMIAFAVVRAIVTIIFSTLGLPIVIDIVTYATLYISITAGALIHCSGLQKA